MEPDEVSSTGGITISRRILVTGLGAIGLLNTTGCSPASLTNLDTLTTGSIRPMPSLGVGESSQKGKAAYAAVVDDGFLLPSVPFREIPAKFRRRSVVDTSGERPGTIVVSLGDRYLYWIIGGGEAIRYGVGVGKAGFEWNGRAVVQYTKKWPTWTPPREMIERKPELVRWQNGQPGGLDNPLGARALYLYRDNVDTGYRIHGSPEWWTIGTQASSGCIRMINQDVIDLYNRVKAFPTSVAVLVL